MFDVQRVVEQCQGALQETDAPAAVREILERTVSKPAEVLVGLGEPKRATVQKIHVADDLTIINVIWGPHMTIMPHNHKMTAIIGVYTGAEDNIFWRRSGDRPGLITAAGARLVNASLASLARALARWASASTSSFSGLNASHPTQYQPS